MLWSQNAFRISPLKLCLLACASFLFGISCALPDASKKPCHFKLTLQNFRSILSWTFKNHSVEPTHYTLQSTIMSKNDPLEMVEGCTNIRRRFCDLTDMWDDIGETYIPQVVAFQGNRTLNSCMDEIRLIYNMSLQPPEFEVEAFTDRVKVILRFPAALPSILEELQYSAPLVVRGQAGKIAKEHKLGLNRNISGNFTYVIDKLIPNTNYCVSVYFKHRDPDVKPVIRCAFLPPGNQSESLESDKAGGIIGLFMLVAVIVTMVLRRTGYICLKTDYPHVLYFKHLPTCTFLELPPLEAMDAVEVILVPRKKKKDYNSEEESDNDQENIPRSNGGGYTMHGLVGRPLDPASMSSATLEDPTQLVLEEVDESEPEAELEPLVAPLECPDSGVYQERSGAYEGRREPPQYSLPGEDSAPEEPEDRRTFNVDLKSVCVRILDEDPDDVPPVLTLPEEMVDLEEPEDLDLPVAFQGGPAPPSASLSEVDQWAEGVPSEETDSCESEVDVGDGYLAR